MVPQIIISRRQAEAVAAGRTCFLFNTDGKCVAVILGQSELDGVSRDDIESAERRESSRLIMEAI